MDGILESFHHLRGQIKLITILGQEPHSIDLRSLGKRKALIHCFVCSEAASIAKFFPEPFDLAIHARPSLHGQTKPIDLSELMGPGIRQLQIIGLHGKYLCARAGVCEALGDLKYCSSMTHLVFNYVCIMPSFVLALSKAIRNGNLPLLEHLSFEGCVFVDGVGPGPVNLFEVGCPTLTDLNLKHCQLREEDLKSIFHCLENKTKYSRMKGLVLSLETFQIRPQCLSKNTRSVWLHELDSSSFRSVIKALNDGYVSSLNDLGLSLVGLLPGEYVKEVLVIEICTLTHLSLHNAIQSMRHLYVLTKSKCLTNLHKLDISHSSGIREILSILLCHSLHG